MHGISRVCERVGAAGRSPAHRSGASSVGIIFCGLLVRVDTRIVRARAILGAGRILYPILRRVVDSSSGLHAPRLLL